MGDYSNAPEAAKKKAIDAKIKAGGKIKIDMNDEGYLKALIAEGGGSVSDIAKGLQFFIIKGGGEGFLDASYAGNNANRIEQMGDTTSASSRKIVMMIFDDNDLLAVFDEKGSLISSALLSRPIYVAMDSSQSGLREVTANKTYDAWDGRSVSLYRNENFTVKYYGLWVDDSLGWYRKGHVRIDLHKEEATNGCIFIKDAGTPSMDHALALNTFEPALILAVQKSIGAKTKTNIGTMHMIEIK